MKKLSCILFACLTLSFVQAQWGGSISGEGSVVTKTLNPGSYSGVVFSMSGEVMITKGSQSFEVTAQQNIIDNLKLEIKDDVLYIGYKKSVKNAKSPKIKISMPSVSKLALSGSGYMEARGFGSSSDLNLSLTGSGTLDVDSGGQEMDVVLSGSGDIKIAGSGGSGDFTVTGSGDIHAKELKLQSAKASITGSGSIALGCQNELKARITGSGDIDVYGSPKVVANVTGSGRVQEH